MANAVMHTDWKLNHVTYTMELVATRVREFFDEKTRAASFKWFLLLRICGTSTNRPLPEVWQISLANGGGSDPGWCHNSKPVYSRARRAGVVEVEVRAGVERVHRRRAR
jgi:hypothetical protein